MATYDADTGNTPPRAPRFGGTITRVGTFTVPTGFLQASDFMRFFTIPKGASLVAFNVVNNGTGQTADIGFQSDDDLFAQAVPDNDTVTPITSGAGINFAFTADTEILGVFNTADPTPGGVVTVRASYVLTP